MNPAHNIRDILYDVANFYAKREFTLDGGDYKAIDQAEQELDDLVLNDKWRNY